MYVNGSCWLEPLCRHLVCYLQNLEQKQTTSRVFVDLFCSKLFSKGALRLCAVPLLCPRPQCLHGGLSEFCCPGLGEPSAPLRHGLCSDPALLQLWDHAGHLLSPGLGRNCASTPLTTDTSQCSALRRSFRVLWKSQVLELASRIPSPSGGRGGYLLSWCHLHFRPFSSSISCSGCSLSRNCCLL